MSKIPTRGPLDNDVKLGIPSVTTDPESLRRAATALTRAIEQLARQRGDVGRSAVMVNDLIKLGLVSPEDVHILDPGGATYTQRGVTIPTTETPPSAPTDPGEPSDPGEHGHSWNDLTDLPDCFDPCSHTHSWSDILDPPPMGGFDPECCGVPVLRCPEGLGNEPFWECLPPDNLEQLANLDCCGIIVRQCATDPVFGWDTTYAALKIADIAPWSASIGDSPPIRRRSSFARHGNVLEAILFEQTALERVIVQNVGGSPFVRWWSRTVDPETGAELTTDTGLMPYWNFASNTSAFGVLGSGRLTKFYQPTSATSPEASRWSNNGTLGPPIRGFFDLLGVSPEYEQAAQRGSIWVPGAGVYSPCRGEAVTSRAICFHPAPLETSMPPEQATNGVLLDTGIAPGAGVELCGYDEDGNIYGIKTTASSSINRIFSYTPDLVLRWEFDWNVNATAAAYQNVLIHGNGRYLVWGDASILNNEAVRVFEIIGGSSLNELTGFATNATATLQYAHWLSPCEISVGASEEIWEVCAGLVVIDPGASASFTCLEIEGTAGRVAVANGDAQTANPVIDLATVDQAVNGNLVAVDIDAWGRVVGNRAVVTADLPPLVEDPATYQFLLADNIPYKQFVYAGGLLVTINLYDDAGLTNLRYSKQLVRTGDFLTSIVLTRHPDLAQWTKTLTYNLDDALETVATAAA